MWQLSKKFVRIVVPLILLMVLLALYSQVEALAWAKRNQLYVNTSQVCRDGAIMTITFFTGTGEDSTDGNGNSTFLGANLYTTSSLPEPDDGTFMKGNSFGPALTASKQFTMTYHGGVPLPADLDDDGIKEYNFYVYGTDTLPWSRHLNPGDKVVFTQGDVAIYALPVSDCYLHQLTVPGLTSKKIGMSYLNTAYTPLATAEVIYRLDSLPAHGNLRLNGTVLNTDDTFTQADIDANRLSYQSTDPFATEDSFEYSVSAVKRVSLSPSGAEGNGDSFDPSISADGRKVAFASNASNFWQRSTGGPLPIITDTNNATDIFTYNLTNSSLTRNSLSFSGFNSDGASEHPDISPDGYAVAFDSVATNIVGSDNNECVLKEDTNGFRDIFVYRFPTEQAYRASISHASGCPEGNSSSAYPSLGSSASTSNIFFEEVIFQSFASTLHTSDSNTAIADIFEHTATLSGAILPVTSSKGADGNSASADIAADTSEIAFSSAATNLVSGDTNNRTDIFVSSAFGDPVRVSVSSTGGQANGHSYFPAISTNARYIAFASDATDLVAGDTNGVRDIFVHDRDADGNGVYDEAGQTMTTRVSVSSSGAQANNTSNSPSISGNGRFIVFQSIATNLVPGDTNGNASLAAGSDIFIHDRETGETRRVSTSALGIQANGPSYDPVVSDDGQYVAFESFANNLIPNDANAAEDVFVAYTGFSSPFNLKIDSELLFVPFVTRP